MTQKNIVLLSALAAAVVALAGCAAPGTPPDIQTLADQTFKASFLPGKGQDLTRLEQDQTQKDCSVSRAAPTKALAATMMAREAQTIVYPADGKLMGDWKAGAKVFNGGFTMHIGSFMPNKPDAVHGGNCYACHQGEAKELAYGNMGSSLLHWGKNRGQKPQVIKYTYEKIYNAKAFNACSAMPRLGHKQILSPKQITDLVAYLVSPDSPINK
ncbi:sulfur oxidation c-type cytochrome SoxX [Rhodoferax sp.]|uniref:sulfur oxidation c-type cytochrome SoxX n=1 Tax=Rhodoferax sp. TaxID=50421 RepID=UPI0026386EDD|nr:sulfur oxidation c-type cytochrome SoxX [Rhodoferax sp.]MDD5478098.1 sulfur oxidation c-type cytochrome SoxX [Rhodoferax sp.]